MPIQNMAFPDYSSHASLIFLPHGVRVIAAWLLGWRSVIALLPGVFLAYYYLAGASVFELSRLIGMAVAVVVAPFLFYLALSLIHHLRAHETKANLVCRLLLEKKKKKTTTKTKKKKKKIKQNYVKKK